MATITRGHPHVAVLGHVPYRTYVRLARASVNRHQRMSYHNGMLEIVTLRLRKHELPSARLRLIITTVADHFGLEYQGTDSTTFSKAGEGPYQGVGKEPDKSFYFASLDRLPRERDPDLNAGNPPPDLWIEVDNRVSSAGRLPVYAAMDVPEVWRYRAETKRLQFLQLVEDRYQPIDRSLSLHMLTPTFVLEALALGEGLPESAWVRILREWVALTFPQPPDAN
jgi:Uma2 family endonuclease